MLVFGLRTLQGGQEDLAYIEDHPNNLIHDPELEGMTWLSIK